MLSGILIFILLATIGLAAEMHVIDRLRHTPLNDWLADHVYLPALRMPALIGFVLGAYPALYGLSEAPALRELLHFNWFGHALNILFVLPLLFSLLPVAGRMSGLILPLQGMALTALLFGPLSAVLGVSSASYWPDTSTWFALFVFGIGGHWLGSALAARLPLPAASAPAYDAAVLVCQAPVMAIYGHALAGHLR